MSSQAELTIESQVAATVKDLAEAVSTQARVANRAWLSLISVAVVFLIQEGMTDEQRIKLPFDFGEVDRNTFFSAGYAILGVLSIAFAAAHAQQIRATILAQSAIDKLGSVSIIGIHPRDLFDMFRLPSVNRVAPLAQLFRGAGQFYSNDSAVGKARRRFSALYYIILKVTATSVYSALPAFALWHAYGRATSVSDVSWWLTGLGIVAGIGLFHAGVADVWYLLKIVRRLGKVPTTPSG